MKTEIDNDIDKMTQKIKGEKRRFRIESGYRGGEVTIGEVSKEFVDYFIDRDESELIEHVTSFGWEEEDIDASIPEPYEDFESWTETDEIVHTSGAYADDQFTYEEVPANGSDDYLYENETNFDPHHLYGREAYHDDKKPEDMTDYKPVMQFHSSEKGGFGAWFIETIGEDFNPKKIAFNTVETMLGEIIEDLWYDKELIDKDWDNADTTGKGYYASVGYMNMKWHDTEDQYSVDYLEENYWEEYDDELADDEDE